MKGKIDKILDDEKLVFIDNIGNKNLGKIQVNVYIGVLCPASR